MGINGITNGYHLQSYVQDTKYFGFIISFTVYKWPYRMPYFIDMENEKVKYLGLDHIKYLKVSVEIHRS